MERYKDRIICGAENSGGRSHLQIDGVLEAALIDIPHPVWGELIALTKPDFWRQSVRRVVQDVEEYLTG
jgi:hypothetical protein